MKNYPVLIIALIAAMFSSCEKVKDATAVSVTKTISLNIEADVFKAGTRSDIQANETNNFSGEKTFSISDYPELREYNIENGTVLNVKVSTSYNKEGDFFAYVIIGSSAAASYVGLEENVIGNTIEGNSAVNSLAQSTVTELIDGESVTVTVFGTTNIPEGEKITYTIAIETRLKTYIL
jgi:hypothetical protein